MSAPITRAQIELDPAHLPLRMTTAEVCALGRFSLASLRRKRALDPEWLKPSTVQGGQSTVFDRAAVLKALDLSADGEPNAPTGAEWTFDPDAFRAARSGKVRHRATAQGRDGSGAVRGPGKAAPIRLVAGNPASGHG